MLVAIGTLKVETKLLHRHLVDFVFHGLARCRVDCFTQYAQFSIVNILRILPKIRKKVKSEMSDERSSSYFLLLISNLKNASNVSEAQVMKKYMKNNFDFYGVRAPRCKELLKQHIENQGLPQDMSELSRIIHYAWDCPHRELQYIGT